MRRTASSCVVLALLAAAPASAQWTEPILMSVWPCATDGRSYGVAVDASGRTIMSDYNNDRLLLRDRDGALLAIWGTSGDGPGGLAVPHDVEVTEAGEVFVVDSGHSRIQVFDMAGGFRRSIGPFPSPANLFEPTYLEVMPSGRVYVSDSQHHRICAYDAGGAFLFSWGGPGFGTPGLFAGPRGISSDRVGNLYIADEANSRIQKFDGEGRFLAQWSVWVGPFDSTPAPRGVFVDVDERVYVTDVRNGRVVVYSTSGVRIGWWSVQGPNDLWNANDLHIDRDGRIVLVGSDCRVKVYARDQATDARRVSWGAIKQRYR